MKVLAAEIGVWRGETSKYLLETFPNLTLLLVDDWREARNKNKNKNMMLSNIAFAAERTVIFEQDSLKASEYMVDGSLDLCFIDSSHEYEHTLKELEAYWPKVRNAGYIGGHDIDSDRHPGVTKAVKEFGQPYTTSVGHTWWIRKFGRIQDDSNEESDH
jgi:predicted O-methyltransferase YrrM